MDLASVQAPIPHAGHNVHEPMLCNHMAGRLNRRAPDGEHHNRRLVEGEHRNTLVAEVEDHDRQVLEGAARNRGVHSRDKKEQLQ